MRIGHQNLSGITAGLFLVIVSQIVAGDDRLADVDRLSKEYENAETEFFNRKHPKEPTPADDIRRYEEWPGWQYLPRFLAAAEAEPQDDAAFRCCLWIIDRTRNVGNNDSRIFAADQKAWDIIAAHHTGRPELSRLCVRAIECGAPAHERFLVGLIERRDLSRDDQGLATLAMAELLAKKVELIGIP